MISSVNNIKHSPINPIDNTVNINSKKILKLIQGLNSNKAHGHDSISIRMLKLCGPLITKPLSFLFSNCLRDGVFPNEWKKANVIPVHKKWK